MECTKQVKQVLDTRLHLLFRCSAFKDAKKAIRKSQTLTGNALPITVQLLFEQKYVGSTVAKQTAEAVADFLIATKREI